MTIVSIHAPARGATSFAGYFFACYVFQSTRPRGARRDYIGWANVMIQVSIHAPAGGATAPFFDALNLAPCFNPRAREGRDTIPPIARWLRRMFQSTRPRGARQQTRRNLNLRPRVSIHAPARGATAKDAADAAKQAVSIHAPARGATSGEDQDEVIITFQSTRPRGARLHDLILSL